MGDSYEKIQGPGKQARILWQSVYSASKSLHLIFIVIVACAKASFRAKLNSVSTMHLTHRILVFLIGALSMAACRPASGPEQEQAAPPAKASPSVPGESSPISEIVQATGLAAKDERVEIILLLPDTRVPLQEFQRNGLAMLISRQAGYKLTTHEAGGEAANQEAQFRQAIDAKPAAIFVSPIDPPALAALIVEATTAGIIVIGLDKRMLNEGCASIVYSDQRRVGRLAGEATLEALKRKATEEGRAEVTGRVIQIRGVEDSTSTNDLATGFTEALSAQPGVVQVHDAFADWKPENATQRTAEAFQLQKQFDVIFAHNDALALGAAKATSDAGQRENIFVIGTDGIPGQKKGIELVRQGDLDATIVQPALVDLALQIVLRLRTDQNFKPLPAYEVEPVAITPKNVEKSLRTGTYRLPKL